MTTKRVVKLDRAALRGLIKEAIQGRQPGDPMWSPERELSEMPMRRSKVRMHSKEMTVALMDLLAQTMHSHLNAMFDENDPSMARAGEQRWEHQVSEAVDEFQHDDDVIRVVDTIVTKLHGGDFYRG